MKTIGITCDNFKIKRFEKELDKSGYDNREVKPLIKDTSVIQIKVEDQDYQSAIRKIKAVCTKVEYHFNRSN